MKKSQLIELRSFIKQFLMEMPWAGALPAATPAWRDDPSEEELQKSNADLQRKLNNFHGSKKFNKEAIWAFGEFPQEVYILPVSGFHGGGDTRTYSLKKQEALDYIENELATGSGSSYVIDNGIDSLLSSGATIIISHIERLKPGFLPTAWMVIHAICDSNPLHIADLNKFRSEIRKHVIENFFIDDLNDCLTMKSGPTLADEGEAAAEIMAQELATKKGFRWKIPESLPSTKKDELEEKFWGLKNAMSDFKGRFIESTQAKTGMAIVVNTYPKPF